MQAIHTRCVHPSFSSDCRCSYCTEKKICMYTCIHIYTPPSDINPRGGGGGGGGDGGGGGGRKGEEKDATCL